MNIFLLMLFCTGTSIGSGFSINGDTKRFLSAAVCSDAIGNCQAYSTACTDPVYKQWVTEHCAKTCNLCPSGTSTGSGGTGNTGGGTTGNDLGCTYNGRIYRKGQTWNDNCKYKCHCLDDISGQYTCNELCLRWKLPTQCHMQPPVIGKCCPKPYCPDGFTINYPPGYVDQ